MKKKRRGDVIFLCQFFYPEYISSAQLPFETAEALTQAGYKVGALCGYPKEYCDEKNIKDREKYHDIYIQRIHYLQMERKSAIGRIVNSVSFIMAAMSKICVLRHYRYVVVYSNPPMLPLVAVIGKKLFKTKIIFVSYDVYPEIAEKAGVIRHGDISYKIFKKINKLLFKNVDKVVAVSKDMKEFLESERNIEKDKVIAIPNWYADKGIAEKRQIDNAKFKEIPENTFVVSYLGNMGTCQDEETLLECIRKLKNERSIHFVFAGHGNKMEKIREIVQKEHLDHVHIYGFLKGKDYEDVLKLSDVFVVTLVKGMKGLCSPSKAYSCLMSGKPVLAVMDEGMELGEVIEETESGYQIEPGDAANMTDMIYGLFSNSKLCEKLGQNARNVFVSKYTKEVCTKEYMKIFQK